MPYTVGVEEEIMILDARDWSLAQGDDEVLAGLSPDIAAHCAGETHRSVIELATGPQENPVAVTREIRWLRQRLQAQMVDRNNGAAHQRRLASEFGWQGLLRTLAGEFSDA